MAAALTDEQIERLHLEYSVTGKVDRAAKAAGVSWAAAKKYLSQPIDPLTPLSQVREQKKIDIATSLGNAAVALIEAMVDKQKLSDAELRDIAVALGITIEKMQLVTGQATERYEHRDVDTSRTELARRIDELADRRRAKQADPRAETA